MKNPVFTKAKKTRAIDLVADDLLEIGGYVYVVKSACRSYNSSNTRHVSIVLRGGNPECDRGSLFLSPHAHVRVFHEKPKKK